MALMGLMLVALLLSSTGVGAQDTFLVVNDFHYDATLLTGRYESCYGAPPDPETERYGTFECEVNMDLLRSTVQAMAQMDEAPKFIVWLGDNTHHILNASDTVFTPEFVVDVITTINQVFTEEFPDTLVLPVMGNHDYWPKNELPAETNPTYQALADLWADWIGSGEEVARFRRAGYYSRLVDEESMLRAVVLNTNLYLDRNILTQGIADPGDQYAWLTDTLNSARSAGEKVLLILHVPVGYSETGSYHFLRQEDNTRLHDVIVEYSDVILACFSGHTHTDTFKLFFNADGEVTSTQFVGPSVVQWLGYWEGATAHNPAFRQVVYAGTSSNMTLEDITTYYMDLPDANAHPDDPDIWKQEYSYRQAYGVDSLSPSEMYRVLTQLKQTGGRSFPLYFKYNAASVVTEADAECDCSCERLHLCAIEFILTDQYEACLEEVTCKASSITYQLAQVIAGLFLYALLF